MIRDLCPSRRNILKRRTLLVVSVYWKYLNVSNILLLEHNVCFDMENSLEASPSELSKYTLKNVFAGVDSGHHTRPDHTACAKAKDTCPLAYSCRTPDIGRGHWNVYCVLSSFSHSPDANIFDVNILVKIFPIIPIHDIS